MCSNNRRVFVWLYEGRPVKELSWGACVEVKQTSIWNPTVGEWAYSENGIAVRLSKNAQQQIAASYDGKPLTVEFNDDCCTCCKVCCLVQCGCRDCNQCCDFTYRYYSPPPVIERMYFGRENEEKACLKGFAGCLVSYFTCQCPLIINQCMAKKIKIHFTEVSFYSHFGADGQIAGGGGGGGGGYVGGGGGYGGGGEGEVLQAQTMQ